jgi:transaldolase
VQKGVYDDLVRSAGKVLAHLSAAVRVIEIAFLLNAHHALRLASRIGCRVSVELHTDLADDVERSVAYGLRYFAIHPEHIIVKIPLTPSGLVATRRLRALGVPVNFTLGFSARQNLIATAFAAPTYLNVFLGRLNAYVANNNLGDGVNVGEKTTLASQRAVRSACRGRLAPTWQIAASMRNGEQVVSLAGVDVHTMPTKVAKEASAASIAVIDRTAEDPEVTLTAIDSGVESLWTIGSKEQALADDLAGDPPETAKAVLERCTKHGLAGLFPALTAEETKAIASDGKIPKHTRWAERIRAGTASVDGLMTAAALASFTADQQALDERIRSQLG